MNLHWCFTEEKVNESSSLSRILVRSCGKVRSVSWLSRFFYEVCKKMKTVKFRTGYTLSLFLTTLFLVACNSLQLPQSVLFPQIGGFDEPEATLAQGPFAVSKSPNDEREYRALVLRNGLKVVLISDESAAKAAASVDVNVGTNSDPESFAGLAHFLEHMLFLGTEKYPVAGEYQEYIAGHGGSHNASTGYDYTNYYFDIDPAYLAPALDRFSQFFIAPLFTAEYVDRERNAVNSEYKSGSENDGRRGTSAYKAIVNPRHPYSRFDVGSLDTLQNKPGITLRAALLSQYARYYSANLMTVAILGKESLDTLELLAHTYFEGVENRNRRAPTTDESLFLEGTLPAILAIEPIRDTRSLSYTFPIPVVREYYKAKPLNYLGNILGHEGEGSLLAILRERGWANGLSAGGGFSSPDNATFTVGISLTEEGVNQVDYITALLFQFIELAREQGIQQWMFDEQKVMADLSFRFQEPGEPISYVTRMARMMQEYPPAELITASYVYEQFDAKLLERIFASLRPDNVLLTLISRTVEGDKVDPWYGTEYSLSAIGAGRTMSWMNFMPETALALNPPNPFLPEDLRIKPYQGKLPPSELSNVAAKPQLLVDADGIRLWFKQDAEFLTPRANFNLYAMTPLFNNTLRNELLSSFVVSLVNDKLSEYSYPANLAGVFFGVSQRARGFTVGVSGYNDKQPQLLETLLQTLTAADFAQERFDIIKTEMIRNWDNASLQTPYTRLFQEVQALLVLPYWSEAERKAAIADISLDDVQAFVPSILDNIRVDALYHGNVVPSDANAMLTIVKKYLHPVAAAPIPPFADIVKLPANKRIVEELEIPHDDSAIVIYIQGEDESLQTRATISLLATIMRTPFFDSLRTEQQLGYVVDARTMPILKTNGLALVIESPVADPVELETRINNFLQQYSSELGAMPAATFAEFKAGLVRDFTEPPQGLSELSNRYWSDIMVEEYSQDSALQMAAAIEVLSLEDLVSWYNRKVTSPSATRVVSRSAGRVQRDEFDAKRNEQAATIILDEGNVDYLPFKQRAEKFQSR
jgi:secreted Zn-dependent insulinase-like peptidase